MLQNNVIAWEIVSSFRGKKSFYYLVGRQSNRVLDVISHRLDLNSPFPTYSLAHLPAPTQPSHSPFHICIVCVP